MKKKKKNNNNNQIICGIENENILKKLNNNKITKFFAMIYLQNENRK